ncbi:MAG: hypothetical protein WDM91_13720 [Rhizomicrobium sp.]
MSKSKLKQLEQLQRVLWLTGGPDYQAAVLKDKTERHAQLMRLINGQFAVVVDGPRAGEIVSIATGRCVGWRRIDVLAFKKAGRPFARRWLLDSERRELTNRELNFVVGSVGALHARRRSLE